MKSIESIQPYSDVDSAILSNSDAYLPRQLFPKELYFYHTKTGRRDHGIPKEIKNGIQFYAISIPPGEDSVLGKDNSQDLLRQNLKKIGLWGDKYLYTAFSPANVKRILKTGTYRKPNAEDPDTIFACDIDRTHNKQGVITDIDYDLFDYMVTVRDQDRRAEKIPYLAFAIYDATKFNNDTVVFPQFAFNNPKKKKDALIAIVKVTDYL